MTLAEQLTKIYLECEDWHERKLSEEEANRYHETILRNGNCITVEDKGNLVGYCEYYVNHGICYIKNLFIRRDYRNGKVIRMMKRRLFEIIGKGRILIGDRNKNNKRYSEVAIRRSNG